MKNENKNKNKNKHESSSLLIVQIDVTNKKESRRSKLFMALSCTIAAATTTAAVVVLTHHSSGAAVVNPIVSTLSSLLGTGRKQGESCGNIWWNACDDNLSCFNGGHSGSGRYCVPNGKKYACCGYFGITGEAAGIDCGPGLYCDMQDSELNPLPSCATYTCGRGYQDKYAAKGSCNVNSGEPANKFVNSECDYVP
mmetsp:Transcript_4124/g.4677  ORF Transcript_4124/g.4677 Transcript_4124/m.4677 type:complete len:196 (-) Transcript_4124:146-733(-)